MTEHVLILVKKETRKKLKTMALEKDMTMIDMVEWLVDKERIELNIGTEVEGKNE